MIPLREPAENAPPPHDPPPAPPGAPSPDDNTDITVGRGYDHFRPDYEIIEPIMTTRLSRTYKAHNIPRNALVVVKELHPELVIQPEALARFKREVQLVARLTSKEIIPGIVPIWDPHLDEWPYFYAMPFIDGEHLTTYCDSHRLDRTARLHLFLKVCRPITQAHKRAVIHRDLKPNNILVDSRGEPYLLDFGLGRVTVTGASAITTGNDSVLGALGYMAPEQAASAPDDVRTDVYALGVILFELLTGSLPIRIESSDNRDDALERIRREEPRQPALQDPTIGWELNLITLKALEKDPDNRFQAVSELTQAVQNYLETRPTPVLTDYGNQRVGQERPPVAPQPVPYLWRYVASRFVQRNKWGVVTALVLGLVAVGLVAAIWVSHVNAANAEARRHEKAILVGRMNARLGNPATGYDVLSEELSQYDDTRTRYALLEFFLRYPCLAFVESKARLVQVEYCPSGELVATVDDAQRVHIYEAPRVRLIKTIPADQTHATRVVFSPDGDNLYTGGADGTVRRVDVAQLTPGTAELKFAAVLALGDDDGAITALAVSPDNTLVAVGAKSDQRVGLVSVWHGRTDEHDVRPLHSWRKVGARVVDLTFSPDSTRLACAAEGIASAEQDGVGGWRLWSLKSWREIAGQDLRRETCRTVRFSADGNTLYVNLPIPGWSAIKTLAPLTAHDGKATLHSLPNAEPVNWGLRSLDAPRGYVQDLIAYGGGDGLIRFYNLRDKRMLSIRGYHDQRFANAVDVCFSPDESFLASVGGDGLRVWDVDPLQGQLLAHAETINWKLQHACSRRSLLLIGAQRAKSELTWNRLALWDAASGISIVERAANEEHIKSLTLSRDGRHLAFGHGDVRPGSHRVGLKVVDLTTEETTDSRNWPGVAKFAACWIEADTRWLLYCAAHQETDDADPVFSLHAWRMDSTGRMTDQIENICSLPGESSGIAVSDDGQWIAIGIEESPAKVIMYRATGVRSATVFSRAFHRQPYEISMEDPCWLPVLVSGDTSQPLVAVGGNRDVRIWEVEDGREYARLKGHRDAVEQCLAFGDGLLLSSGRDRRVLLWDLATKEELCELYAGSSSSPEIAVQERRICITDENRLMTLDCEEVIRRLVPAHQLIP